MDTNEGVGWGLLHEHTSKPGEGRWGLIREGRLIGIFKHALSNTMEGEKLPLTRFLRAETCFRPIPRKGMSTVEK